jgi:hypothetical protein
LAFLGLAGCSSDTDSPVFGSPPALEKDAPFGAVAFSASTQKWKIVSDLPSRPIARTIALSDCQENDCKVLAEFSRGECLSLSLDAARAITTPQVSVSRDASSIMNVARQSCYSAGGQDCKASSPICN